jgi:hypothetical protein
MTTLNYWNQNLLVSRTQSLRPERTAINWGLIAALGLDLAAWAIILNIAL